MEKGAEIYSLNGGSLNPVSGVLLIVHVHNTHKYHMYSNKASHLNSKCDQCIKHFLFEYYFRDLIKKVLEIY